MVQLQMNQMTVSPGGKVVLKDINWITLETILNE